MTDLKSADAIRALSRKVYHAAQRVGLPAQDGVRLVRWLAERCLLTTAAARYALARVFRRRTGRPLCIVVHDAHRHGAQILALELAETLFRVFGLDLYIVLLGPGPLASEFGRYGHVYELYEETAEAYSRAAAALARYGVRDALCNSVASGLFIKPLTAAGIRCVVLVHELPRLIKTRHLEKQVEAIQEGAAAVVFPSASVEAQFPLPTEAASVVRPQGLGRRLTSSDRARSVTTRKTLRDRLGIPAAAPLVLNMGYGDKRKGIDLFVAIGAIVMETMPDAHFVWLGNIEPNFRETIDKAVEASGHSKQFIFPGFAADVRPYLLAADLFALTSREDPFPTVLLQAMDASLPAIAFEGGGGFVDLLQRGAGILALHGDVDAFAMAVMTLLRSKERHREIGRAGCDAVRGGYSMQRYAFDLAALARVAPPKVSVVVPSFNYARYLPDRLRSIVTQSLTPYELIVLDDCSTDNSVAIAEAALADVDIESRIIAGRQKAPSVFRQWLRGVRESRGDFVWIAEADDLSDAQFLETVSKAFSEPEVVLSYCQSRQINDRGRLLDSDYLTYTSDIDRARWGRASVTDGREEIRAALAVKNTIPNVSACIFRKDVLLRVLEQHIEEISRFRVAGDWMTYIRLLECGRIAYHPRALNDHRRHAGSVTASALSNVEALCEIEEIQDLVRREFAPSLQVDAIARAYTQTLRSQFGLS